MDILLKSVLSALVVMMLMLGWYGVQRFSERYKKAHPEQDPVCEKHTAHCNGCALRESCDMNGAK